jgi:hypothetical protein
VQVLWVLLVQEQQVWAVPLVVQVVVVQEVVVQVVQVVVQVVQVVAQPQALLCDLARAAPEPLVAMV